MARFIKDRILAKGEIPGAMIFIGEQKTETPEITLMDYTLEKIEEKELQSISEIIPYMNMESVTWLNIYGLHDMELIQELDNTFNIRSLFIEDILNTDHLPKYENNDNYDGFILKLLYYDQDKEQIKADQIALLLTDKFVLTFREQKKELFNPLRERIRKNKGRIRKLDNDYLAYTILDTIVDNYLQVIELLGRKIEENDLLIFNDTNEDISERIYNAKTELGFIRMAVRPAHEVVKQLMKSEKTFFQEENTKYINDLFELTTQATNTIEFYNNLVSDQLNICNTIASNKMNQIMKVLTIFASIFIPLTFIAGVYGMNFEYIPELGYRNSYFIFWGVILSIGIGLLYFFRRKKWL